MKTQWYHHRLFKPGYGRFPYLIVKIGHAYYMQVPIHFLHKGQSTNIQTHPGIHVCDVPKLIFQLDRKTQIEYLYEEIMAASNTYVAKIRV